MKLKFLFGRLYCGLFGHIIPQHPRGYWQSTTDYTQYVCPRCGYNLWGKDPFGDFGGLGEFIHGNAAFYDAHPEALKEFRHCK